MASSSNKISGIGIICEDTTDYDAIRVLISRIVDVRRVRIKSKVGNGCSKIKSKCVVWSQDLKNRKCDMLIVLHDLDRNDYTQLTEELSSKLKSSAISNNFLSIPVEEFEAWLIADPEGIRVALNLKRLPKFSGVPEAISSPKEKLRDEVYKCSNKEIYYQTSMNQRIASSINLDEVCSKCPSFNKLVEYLRSQKFS